MSFVFQPSLIPGLETVIPPYAEPVSLTEMKLHIKQDDITADDAIVMSLISTARNVVETETGKNTDRSKVMLSTTFNQYRDVFPAVDYIQLYRVPCSAVVSITYIDTNGVLQTLATSVWVLDSSTGRIHLQFQQVWPPTQFQRKSITITFIAGMASSFTATVSGHTVTIQGGLVINGQRLRLMSTGLLPTGLSTMTDYFVIGLTGSTFQLSLSSGGSAVTFTDIGTVGETHFMSLNISSFGTLRDATKLLAAYWNGSREAVITGTRAAAVLLPFQIEAMISTEHA